MQYTLETLLQQVGCSKYPQLFQDIFSKAMETYNQSGCFLTDRAYYDRLHEQYGCFEKYYDVYVKAAAQVAQDEALGRFLVLLVESLLNEETRNLTADNLGMLSVPEGKNPLGYRMLWGLAVCAQIDGAANRMRKRGLPEKYICSALTDMVNCVSNYALLHEGEPGYGLLIWAQKFVEGRLFTIQRLQIELHTKLSWKIAVFRNAAGDVVTLAGRQTLHRSGYPLGSLYCTETEDSFEAGITETEDAWIGHPYREDGFVEREKVILKKSEWIKVLAEQDPVVELHIPENGRLNPEEVSQSLEQAKEFIAQYFPEYAYKGWITHTWMVDPRLTDILPESSNIIQFMRRFRKVGLSSQGENVFYFIFHKPNPKPGVEFQIETLPAKTTLERGIRQYYLDGKVIYEMGGFFLPEAL